jgi:hypothetical protein
MREHRFRQNLYHHVRQRAGGIDVGLTKLGEAGTATLVSMRLCMAS